MEHVGEVPWWLVPSTMIAAAILLLWWTWALCRAAARSTPVLGPPSGPVWPQRPRRPVPLVQYQIEEILAAVEAETL